MNTIVSNLMRALALLALPGALLALEPPLVQIVRPETLAFRVDPNVPGVGIAVVAGDPKTAGPYTIRARFAPNAHAAPHRHPDTRTVTVLSGTYYFAQGESFNPAQLQPYTAGTVLIVTAGTPHFSAAREEETVVQETGVGPTGLELVQPRH